MSYLDSCVDIVINEVFKKIGILIPRDIIEIKEMKKWTKNGEYNALRDTIYINPNIVRFNTPKKQLDILKAINRYNSCDDDKYSKELLWDITRDFNNSYVLDVLFVLFHEIGHYIHNHYFGFEALYIPHYNKNKWAYEYKNHRENFAEGFADYMLGNHPLDSKRYKKIQKLMNNIKECC